MKLELEAYAVLLGRASKLSDSYIKRFVVRLVIFKFM